MFKIILFLTLFMYYYSEIKLIKDKFKRLDEFYNNTENDNKILMLVDNSVLYFKTCIIHYNL